MGEVCQQLLDVAGESRDLVVLGSDLMKHWRRRIGYDVQPDVKDTGNQALGIQSGAETLADQLVELWLVADIE